MAPYSGPNTDQSAISAGYNSDSLINNEVGFKSEFLDHHALFNLSMYYMKWENIQQLLFDPVHLGNTSFNVNGSSYTIKGFEVQFVARITDGLSVQGSSSVNSLSQSSTPCLISVGVNSEHSQELRTTRLPKVIASRRSTVRPTRIRSASSALGRRSRRRGCSTCLRDMTGRPAHIGRSPGSVRVTSPR